MEHLVLAGRMAGTGILLGSLFCLSVMAGAGLGAEKEYQPYYTILKLPEGKKEEFVVLLPFTPSRKDNMAAWMAGRCDVPHYGELVVYVFPKQKLVFGPRQIEARIDQEAEISKQLSLWGQRGSQVIRGDLLAIPIEKSILYVEPLYLAAEKSQLPELKRVIIAFGNSLAMEETLELDFSFGVKGLARFRANVFFQRGAVAGAFRTIPDTVWTLEDIGASGRREPERRRARHGRHVPSGVRH